MHDTDKHKFNVNERCPANKKVFWQISLLTFVFMMSVAIHSVHCFSLGMKAQRIE